MTDASANATTNATTNAKANTNATPEFSHNEWQEATIESIVVQTPTVKSFLLRPKHWPHFIAGQHIDVRLTAPDGYEAHRSYSISSSPDTVGTIELAIERLTDGEVSPYFHDVAIVGDTVDVRGPFTEHFIWRENHDGQTLLVGGGSGIAPLVSMLRHRATIAKAPAMSIVYSARSWSDVIFRDELLSHEKQQSGLKMFFVLTRDATAGAVVRNADFNRRVDNEILTSILGAIGYKPDTCFVCGNNNFVGTVADVLVAMKIPAESIKTERYGE
ncbi:MAG: ferredoxin reductase [Gemmatimonadaceae bacterium]